MRQSERPHLVQGTLLDQRKILHDVELVIVVKPKLGQGRMNEETLPEIKLVRQSPVLDGGPYTLQYAFDGKQHKDRVFIKSGKLEAAKAS